jgi:hypothetical protein
VKTFKPDGEVLRQFMASKAPVKIIQGPIGSGKSLGSIMCIWMKALEQVKQADGKRKCRAHVFRDTYGKLEDTTIKSWLEWFPENEFGRFYRSKPMLHEIRVGDIELDVHFVALEDESAADYFKSLETTICFFNEVQFIDRALVDEATSRVGRYPRVIDGGAVGPQVVADMNAPDETHWVPLMRQDVAIPDWMTADQRRALIKPKEWEFFVQPAGLIEVKDNEGEVVEYEPNPKAENLKFLPGGAKYYLNAILGKGKSWIDANVLNRVSPRRDGKPVLKDFSRAVYVAKQPLAPIPGQELVIGLRLRAAAGGDLCAMPARPLVHPARTDRARHGRQDLRAAAAQRPGAAFPGLPVQDLGRPVGRLQGPERRDRAVPDFPREQAADPAGAVVPVHGAAADDRGGDVAHERGQARSGDLAELHHADRGAGRRVALPAHEGRGRALRRGAGEGRIFRPGRRLRLSAARRRGGADAAHRLVDTGKTGSNPGAVQSAGARQTGVRAW